MDDRTKYVNFLAQFQDMLSWEDDPEGACGRKNEMFAALMTTPTLCEKLVMFAIDALSRVSLLDQKSKATTIARLFVSHWPMMTKFFNSKKINRNARIEEIDEEIRLLNLQYLQVRKLASYLLDHNGEVTMSKAFWDAIDEKDFELHYAPEFDRVYAGTLAHAKKRKKLGDVVKEEREAMEPEQREEIERKEAFIAEKIDAAQPTMTKHAMGDGRVLYRVQAEVGVPIEREDGQLDTELRTITGTGKTEDAALNAFNQHWTGWPAQGGAGRQFPLTLEEVRKIG